MTSNRSSRILIIIILLIATVAPLSCAAATKSKDVKKPKPAVSKAAKPAAKPAPAAQVSGVISLGRVAPELFARDIDGKNLKLSNFKGRPLVIAFWDVRCDVCIKQIAELEAGLEKSKAKTAVLAVSQDQGPDKNKQSAEILKKAGVKAIPGFDIANKTGESYGIMGIPFFAIIDKDGKVQGGGSMLVSQKIRTMTLTDIAAKLSAGESIPKCEFAEMKIPSDYEKMAGKEAPNFKLTDLKGDPQSPSFFSGFSRLLLVFWAPTCPHCRAELPRIEQFKRERADKLGLKILGVVGMPQKSDPASEQFLDLVKQIVEQDKISFPVALDYGQKTRELYNVEGVPSLFLVGVDGTIEHAWRGEALFVGRSLECVLEKLKAGDVKK